MEAATMANSEGAAEVEANGLEELVAKYSGERESAANASYGKFIDTRFEGAFNIISQGILSSFTDSILGPSDTIEGIVLRVDEPLQSTPSDPAATPEAGLLGSLMDLLGMKDKVTMANCRILVLKTKHTDILPVPKTYDETVEDYQIISNYPLFVYSPEITPIPAPGTWIRGVFNLKTYRSGVITETLSREAQTLKATAGPLAGLFDNAFNISGVGGLGSSPTFTGETPNANRLRYMMNQLSVEGGTGPVIREKVITNGVGRDMIASADGKYGESETVGEISNAGDITQECERMTSTLLQLMVKNIPELTKIRVIGGNDIWHWDIIKKPGGYKSRHCYGRAMDITVHPNNKTTVAKTEMIMRSLSAGSAPNFRFLNEYTNPTKFASGPHFHFSWGVGTEGKVNMETSQAMAAAGKITAISIDTGVEVVDVPSEIDMMEAQESGEAYSSADTSEEPAPAEDLWDAPG
jgi:hypothetical protein